MEENKSFAPETEEEEAVTAEEETAEEKDEAANEDTSEEEITEESDEEEDSEEEESNEEDAEDEESDEEAEDADEEEPKKNKKTNKAALISALVAVFIAVVMIVVAAVGGAGALSSPKSVLEKAVDYIEAGEYAKALECTSATQFFMSDNISDEQKTVFIRENICGSFIEKVEAGSGLSIEITEIKEYTEEEIALVKGIFTYKDAQGNDVSAVNIEALQGVTFNWVVEETGEKYEDFVYLIKEEGKWTVRW